MSQLDLELEALRGNLKSMTEYASKLDASNDDYQADNEALRKELAEARTIIHCMQDGSLARDQAGVIERANARIAELEAETLKWGISSRLWAGDADRAEAMVKELEAENRLLRARPMHKRPDFRDGIPSDEE